ncbi:MAG: M20 family metallopeptidase [Hungatella sp.]
MNNKLEEIAEKMVLVRHHLHRNPELSFREYGTCDFLTKILDSYKISYTIVAQTGILAVVEGAGKGDDVLVRADIDALPIREESGCEYSSSCDAMHACGHDIHTSVLLGLLIYLVQNRELFSGRLVGLFQPGEEESPGGASLVLAEGVLDNFNIKAAYALHTAHDMEVGKFGVRRGEYMASTSEMRIMVHGTGGHAALPKGMINPILIASKLILALKEVEQSHSDVIIAVGRVIAEGSTNVIPTSVSMSGTVRAMNLTGKAELKDKIRALAKELGDIEVSFTDGYPPIYNNRKLAEKSIAILKKEFGDENIIELGLRMTADDFGFFSELYPSFYYRLGVKGDWDESFAPHTPKFKADDKAIYYGIKSLIELIKVP